MKNNLKEEIQTIRKNMGLISESFTETSFNLARTLYKYLQKTGEGKKFEFKNQMEDLKKWITGKGGNKDEIEKIIGFWIKKNANVAQKLGTMIYDSLRRDKAQLRAFTDIIQRAKIKGVKFETVNDNIKDRVKKMKISGYQNKDILDYIRDRIALELEKEAYLIYTTKVDQLKGGWNQTDSGISTDQKVSVLDALGYSLSRGYQGLKKTLSYFTSGKVKPWDTEFHNKYDVDEIRAINQWFIAGLPDTPAVWDSFQKRGVFNATGRAARQLFKKYLALTFWFWLFEYLNDGFKVFKGERKLTEWEKERLDNDGMVGELAVQLNRMWRTLDFAPALKYTSPAVLAGWGLVDTWLASGRGDKEVQKNRFLQFLDPKKDKAILKPSEFVDDFIWLAQHLPEVNKNIAENLAQTRRELQAMGELSRNNQKVDSTDKVVTADTKKTIDTTTTNKPAEDTPNQKIDTSKIKIPDFRKNIK